MLRKIYTAKQQVKAPVDVFIYDLNEINKDVDSCKFPETDIKLSKNLIKFYLEFTQHFEYDRKLYSEGGIPINYSPEEKTFRNDFRLFSYIADAQKMIYTMTAIYRNPYLMTYFSYPLILQCEAFNESFLLYLRKDGAKEKVKDLLSKKEARALVFGCEDTAKQISEYDQRLYMILDMVYMHSRNSKVISFINRKPTMAKNAEEIKNNFTSYISSNTSSSIKN